MFSKSKKAISAVITTLILVALVLAAISVSWLVINKVLNRGETQVAESQQTIYDQVQILFGEENPPCSEDQDCEEGICVNNKCIEAPISCSENLDCGTDGWISNTEYCNQDNLLQRWKEYTCSTETCQEDETTKLKENCTLTEKICFAGECIEEPVECSENSDCGTDGWVPDTEYCDQDNVLQKWKEYTCENETCQEEITDQFRENCTLIEKTCFEGECFVQLECFEHSDCEIGEMCADNTCIPELIVNSGTIYSIWPLLGGAEYFDSTSIPKSETSYLNYFIRFTGPESRCLKIIGHVYPPSLEYNSYFKLSAPSSIQASNNYEIWQTLWGCSN